MKKIFSLGVGALVFAGFAGQAFAFNDGFDYAAGQPAPSPWTWTRSGASSQVIQNGELHAHYSGSGWIKIARRGADISPAHPPGGGVVYSIQFYDDGSNNAGMLFKVGGPNGWCAIGVNNNVASGKYYFRTDQSAGNTGTVIPVNRNGASASGNWHTFQIYVRDDGAYPIVDGIPISNSFRYAPLAQADYVELQLDWGKPVWDAYLDNFSVEVQTPCAYLTCFNYQIVAKNSFYAANQIRNGFRPSFPDNEIQPSLNGWARTSYVGTAADLFRNGVDPAPGWAKDLILNYVCDKAYRGVAYVPPEAVGSRSPDLDCADRGPARRGKIKLTEALYAANVGHPTPVATKFFGGASRLDGIADNCNGFGICDYWIESRLWGNDPAPNQAKDLTVKYVCSEDPDVEHVIHLGGEADHHFLHLSCDY